MAPKQNGLYYMGRVNKLGQLNNDLLSNSILNPKSIIRGKHAWTFIETIQLQVGEIPFIYGKLSKYHPDAEIKVVEPIIRAEVKRDEPNLSIATSPFLYIPYYSGIVFMHVSGHIMPKIFMKRFQEIIEESNGNFFVNCEIEPITDLRTFATKLKLLDSINQISATVHPPNPLFGPLWKSLREYIVMRRTDSMYIKEDAKEKGSINTDLARHVAAVADQTEDRVYKPDNELPIGDAAILMAADGYGTGQVRGLQGDTMIVIKTSETMRNFSFERDPDPVELFKVASKLFDEIEQKRHLQH